MYSLDVAQRSLGGCLKVTKKQSMLQGSGEFLGCLSETPLRMMGKA